MLAYECPRTPLKISLPENETTVNLKSASFTSLSQLYFYTKVSLIFNHKYSLGCFLAGVSLQPNQGWDLKGAMKVKKW